MSLTITDLFCGAGGSAQGAHDEVPVTAATDAWLMEMWQPCRELPAGERAAKRAADLAQQRALEDLLAIRDATPVPFLTTEEVA